MKMTNALRAVRLNRTVHRLTAEQEMLSEIIDSTTDWRQRVALVNGRAKLQQVLSEVQAAYKLIIDEDNNSKGGK